MQINIFDGYAIYAIREETPPENAEDNASLSVTINDGGTNNE